MPKASISVYLPVDKNEFEKLCLTRLPSIPNTTVTKESDYFILKEKTNLTKGTYGVTAEIKYDNNTVTINGKCGGIGPFQKNHVNEIVNMIKGQLERGADNPDEKPNPDVVKCPKCGSTQIAIVKRGWSLATGFIGSGANERVCKNCMYKF